MNGPRRRRRVNPVVVLAVLALIPGLLLFVAWRWADGRAEGEPPPTSIAPPAPAPSLATPLLSFRRAPAVLSRQLNIAAFQGPVAEFAGSLEAPSCVAVAVDGVAVGGARIDVPLIPASNQKVLVGAVALEVLGEAYTYTTDVRAAATPVGGTLSGDLYLVGGGDPLLTSSTYPTAHDPVPVTSPTSLDALADAVVDAGVQRVEGAVVGDASRYDDERFVPTWDNDIRGIEAGPYDALLVNDARVTGDPLRAAEPAQAAARELTQLLADRGVTVAGAPVAGAAPAQAAVLGTVTSAPMSAVVGEMLATSDDNTAELLVKELGVAGGGGGTRAAGIAVMTTTLTGWGVPMAGVTIDDGSGLSNANRLTCQALLAVLGRHTPDDAFGAGLAVAGESGTLSDVFTDSPLRGRLRGKTGTLGNAPYNADPPAVKSLSGYVPIDGGGAVQFALILNAAGTLTDQGVYRPIWNRLADVLATYPSGPTPAALAPR